MTKISDLDNLPGSLAGNAILPGVQSGTTYGITADQIKTYVETGGGSSAGSGVTMFGGGTAAPIITRDLVYGVPQSISIVSGGDGYDNANGTVLCCGHVEGSGLTYGTTGPGGDVNYNAAEYLARGLHVKVTVTNGEVVDAKIVNPGQMFRVGDQLDITLQKSVYSNGGTTTAGGNFTPAKIRIDVVEPFMDGFITNNHSALGGTAPNVLKGGVGYGAALASGSSFSRKNPNKSGVSPTYSSGEYFPMEMDWTAPLFMAHTQSAQTEGDIAPTATGQSTHDFAGFDHAYVGHRPFAGHVNATQTTSHQVHTFNLAVPGVWAIVYQTKSSSSPFTNDGNMYKSESSSAFEDQWQTVDRMLPEYTAGQLRVNGAFATGNGVEHGSPDSVIERGELHVIVNPALDIPSSQIQSAVSTAIKTKATINGVSYNGVYNPAGSNTTREVDSTTTSFAVNTYQQHRTRDTGHNNANVDHTWNQYQQCSFYFVNVFDLLGNTSTS